MSTPRSRFDLSHMKSIDALSNPEIPVRCAILSVGAVAASWFFEDLVFLLYAAVYFPLLALYLWVLHRAPQEVPRLSAIGLMAFCALILLILLSCIGYMWTVHGGTGRIIGCLLLFGAMMNTVSLRSQERAFLIIDVGCTGLAVLVLAVLTFVKDGPTNDTGIIIVALVAMFIHFFVVAYDVARTRHELVQVQRQEVQRARLEAVGRLTGGVAHDFNNLLTVIQGNLQLRRVIQRQGGSLIEAEQLVREAEDATERAARTTQQLLAYSRKSVLHPQWVSIADVIDNMDRLLRSSLPANVELRLDVPGDLPRIKIDVGQLENVLLNLVLNARDAMPDGGVVQLTAASGYCANNIFCVNLKVSDTGEGIAPEFLDKVTEPYFTTKTVGKGSGLGLAMARGVMEQSGGVLEITSKLNEGTTVRLAFPVTEMAEAVSAE